MSLTQALDFEETTFRVVLEQILLLGLNSTRVMPHFEAYALVIIEKEGPAFNYLVLQLYLVVADGAVAEVVYNLHPYLVLLDLFFERVGLWAAVGHQLII